MCILKYVHINISYFICLCSFIYVYVLWHMILQKDKVSISICSLYYITDQTIDILAIKEKWQNCVLTVWSVSTCHVSSGITLPILDPLSAGCRNTTHKTLCRKHVKYRQGGTSSYLGLLKPTLTICGVCGLYLQQQQSSNTIQRQKQNNSAN